MVVDEMDWLIFIARFEDIRQRKVYCCGGRPAVINSGAQPLSLLLGGGRKAHVNILYNCTSTDEQMDLRFNLKTVRLRTSTLAHREGCIRPPVDSLRSASRIT